MSAGSRVELYAAIRRDARAGNFNANTAWDGTPRSRTGTGVAGAAGALPATGVQARSLQARPRSDPDRGLDAPRKQRHTITRIFDRLRAEHDMNDVSYPVVRAYVAKRRLEIGTDHGRAETTAFIPQTHLPGREAEVDFGEISVRLRGEPITCHLFALRMSYSGQAVHRVSATGGQEAFFEGHVHAFKVLGGVPAGRIRYDNLKAAVAQVIGFSRRDVEAVAPLAT